MRRALAQVAYALVFAVGVPVVLVACARGAAPYVGLPAVHAFFAGVALTSCGVALVLLAMHALRVHGGGLPMNAFPPPRYVARGPYALVSHPIYVGFSAAVLGVSIAAGSASGLWLVFPMTCLGCAALVLGYEAHDLRRRFGAASTRPWLSLAGPLDDEPRSGHRAAFYVLVLAPWIAAWEGLRWVAPSACGHGRSPVLSASLLGALLAVPWLAPTQRALRRVSVDGLLALGWWLAWAACAPSLAASACTVWASLLAGSLHRRPRWPAVALVLVSFVAAGSTAQAAVGVAIGLVAGRTPALWSVLRAGAERIAGSWREWRFGPVRLINHGVYAAAGTFLALAILGTLAGPGSSGTVLVISGCTLIGAGAWAQWIEGASGLSRPYGFYGGMIGAIAGCFIEGALGKSTWLLLAATCTSGPWVQSLGRVRCLVQGCCHGAPSSPAVGIRYVHPRSRVSKAPALVGVPLHPTPLYSILWNVVLAIVTARLWAAHAAVHLLCGVYLMLGGFGRFVEEAYRGEPQTPVLARLRLYQWVAVGTVVGGVAILIFGRSGPAPAPYFDARVLAAACVGAVGNFIALGVDFPEARWRLSRLA